MADDHCHDQSTVRIQMQASLFLKLHAKQILEEILGISDIDIFVESDKVCCVFLICERLGQCVYDMYLEQVIT